MSFGFLDFPFGPMVWQLAIGVLAGVLAWLMLGWRRSAMKLALLPVIGIVVVFAIDALALIFVAPQLKDWQADDGLGLLSMIEVAGGTIVAWGVGRVT